MIAIVDNGKGADNIARMIRGTKVIVKPDKISAASAYILSDGDMKNQKHNEKLIKSTRRPLLAIGVGSLFLAAA